MVGGFVGEVVVVENGEVDARGVVDVVVVDVNVAIIVCGGNDASTAVAGVE